MTYTEKQRTAEQLKKLLRRINNHFAQLALRLACRIALKTAKTTQEIERLSLRIIELSNIETKVFFKYANSRNTCVEKPKSPESNGTKVILFMQNESGSTH